MEKRSNISHGDMAIQWASTVIMTAHDTVDLSLSDQLDYYGIDYLNKAIKPHRKTILHDYVEAVIMDNYSYTLGKHFPGEVIMDLDECMKYYQVDLTSLGERSFQFDSDGELKCGDFDEAEVYAEKFLDLFEKSCWLHLQMMCSLYYTATKIFLLFSVQK